MVWDFKNKSTQGLAGLGAAIKHFTGLGYCVSVPLADTAAYDLLVDDGASVLRVQVKTTSHKKKGTYFAKVSTDGGNRTNGNTIRTLKREELDVLFILTEDGTSYSIPIGEVGGVHGLHLGPKYDKYKV